MRLDPRLASTDTRIRVRFCETDLMGIVHHANYLGYFEEARVDWLRKRGITYADWAGRGIHLPVVEARTRYRAPLTFDDVFRVSTRLTELRSHSVRFEYTTWKDKILVAEGSTRLACVGNDHRLMRIPDGLVANLFEGERAE